jgi:hypothetical protein
MASAQSVQGDIQDGHDSSSHDSSSSDSDVSRASSSSGQYVSEAKTEVSVSSDAEDESDEQMNTLRQQHNRRARKAKLDLEKARDALKRIEAKFGVSVPNV